MSTQPRREVAPACLLIAGLTGTRRPAAVRNQRLSRFISEVCLPYPASRGPVLPPAGVPLGPSAFQEVYRPESAYLEKAPTAQLTRIGAAGRLFSLPLNTHNKCTGVCRFVRRIPVGIGRRVAELRGFCGLAGALTGPDDPARGTPRPRHHMT